MGLDSTAKNFRSVSNIRAKVCTTSIKRFRKYNFLKTQTFNQRLGRQNNIIQFMHSIEINIRICHPEKVMLTSLSRTDKSYCYMTAIKGLP